MRDHLESHEHWDKMYKLLNEKILWNESLINEAVEKFGEESTAAKRAYTLQFANFISYQNTLYSSGASLGEIVSIYPKIVTLFEKAWDKSFGYVQMVWMLSVGIMLNIDSALTSQLISLVRRDALDDFLTNYLINSIDSSWPITKTEFLYENPYKETQAVINATSEKSSVALLADYLANKWYRGHRDSAWYDRHKRNNSIYDGYWSYESGAIVKILHLDDSALLNVQYYPYDMVHY